MEMDMNILQLVGFIALGFIAGMLYAKSRDDD